MKQKKKKRKFLRKRVNRSSESEILQRTLARIATTSIQLVSKVISISLFAQFGSDRQLSPAELLVDACSNAELPQ
jgi:hypothetical protein